MVARRGHWLLLALVGVLGCRTPVAALRGVAEYRERLRLPPGALLEVDLLELRPGMAPAVVQRRSLTPAAWPADFELDVDRTAVATGASYALVARVKLEERVVFQSEEPVPVDLEAPHRVQLTLARQR